MRYVGNRQKVYSLWHLINFCIQSNYLCLMAPQLCSELLVLHTNIIFLWVRRVERMILLVCLFFHFVKEISFYLMHLPNVNKLLLKVSLFFFFGSSQFIPNRKLISKETQETFIPFFVKSENDSERFKWDLSWGRLCQPLKSNYFVFFLYFFESILPWEADLKAFGVFI